jgi:hypothetical protein
MACCKGDAHANIAQLRGLSFDKLQSGQKTGAICDLHIAPGKKSKLAVAEMRKQKLVSAQA